jgi:hypothetical protein
MPRGVKGSGPGKTKAQRVERATRPKVVPLRPVLSETIAPGTEGQMPRQTKVRSPINLDTGLTEKQEAFCQGVTSGLSLSDAYRAAYNVQNMQPASIHTNACKLFADAKIMQRLRAINREMDEKRRMMAASDAALALRVLREMAEKADTDASRIRAAELLAKAGGVFTEQVEITDKTERNEAEVEQAIAQRLVRLGLTSKAG